MIDSRFAVLGRGKSLRKFSKFSHLFDTIYIVGTFYKEIKKIGVEHFKGKKIIHLVGRSDWGWRNNIDKKLNIKKVQIMYHPYQLKGKKEGKSILERFKKFEIIFLPEFMESRGFPVLEKEVLEKYFRKYNSFNELCSFLESKFKKEIKKNIVSNKRNRYWPTTGVFAIDMCLMERSPKELYLFGIDACYDVSFVKYKWEDFKYNWKYHKKDRSFTVKEKLIIYYIKELVKEFPETNFYTASKIIKSESSNWNFI